MTHPDFVISETHQTDIAQCIVECLKQMSCSLLFYTPSSNRCHLERFGVGAVRYRTKYDVLIVGISRLERKLNSSRNEMCGTGHNGIFNALSETITSSQRDYEIDLLQRFYDLKQASNYNGTNASVADYSSHRKRDVCF